MPILAGFQSWHVSTSWFQGALSWNRLKFKWSNHVKSSNHKHHFFKHYILDCRNKPVNFYIALTKFYFRTTKTQTYQNMINHQHSQRSSSQVPMLLRVFLGSSMGAAFSLSGQKCWITWRSTRSTEQLQDIYSNQHVQHCPTWYILQTVFTRLLFAS